MLTQNPGAYFGRRHSKFIRTWPGHHGGRQKSQRTSKKVPDPEESGQKMEVHAQDSWYEMQQILSVLFCSFQLSNLLLTITPAEKESPDGVRAFWKQNADEIVACTLAFTTFLESAKGTPF